MVIISDYNLIAGCAADCFFVENAETLVCPNCGAFLKHRDRRQRIFRSDGGSTQWFVIERRRCSNEECHKIHNILPDKLVPYKHYASDLIADVLDEIILPEDPINEDLPCDATLFRWLRWFKANRLRIESLLWLAWRASPNGIEIAYANCSSLLNHIRNTESRWLSVVLCSVYNAGGSVIPI